MRAFGDWIDRHGKGRRTTGDRSVRERLLRQIVEDVSWTDAPASSKRALRNRIRLLADGIAMATASASISLIEDVRAALRPETPDELVVLVAEDIHQSLRLQLYAGETMHVLRLHR